MGCWALLGASAGGVKIPWAICRRLSACMAPKRSPALRDLCVCLLWLSHPPENNKLAGNDDLIAVGWTTMPNSAQTSTTHIRLLNITYPGPSEALCPNLYRLITLAVHSTREHGRDPFRHHIVVVVTLSILSSYGYYSHQISEPNIPLISFSFNYTSARYMQRLQLNLQRFCTGPLIWFTPTRCNQVPQIYRALS